MESRTESGSENMLETSSVTPSRAASSAVEAENTESIKCIYKNAHFLQILLITFWSLSCYFPCSRVLAMLSECELDGFKNYLPIRITGFTWTQCATFLGRRGSQQQSNNSLSVKVWNLDTSNPRGQMCYLWVCWKSWPMWLQGSCLQSMKSNVDWEKLFTTGKKKNKPRLHQCLRKERTVTWVATVCSASSQSLGKPWTHPLLFYFKRC